VFGDNEGFMKALAAAFTSGTPGTEIKDPDGTIIRIQEPDGPGVARVLEGEGAEGPWKLRLYEPLASRPAQFPVDYPFVEGAMCAFMTSGPRNMMTWVGGNAAEYANSAAAESLATGWTEEVAMPTPGMPDQRRFRKEGRIRAVFHQAAGPAGFATLWEMPQD